MSFARASYRGKVGPLEYLSQVKGQGVEWRDEGALLSVRAHGESSAIIEVFTPEHGRHAGVVRGGSSRRFSAVLQPGAQLDLSWRARLDEHIGTFTVEPLRQRAHLLEDRLALAGLNSICALLRFVLPDREPHPPLYERTVQLLDTLGGEGWIPAYLRWELRLLEELGYGLDLSSCAVTGTRDDLLYVSPKSGRAVSGEGAGDWADRLLPLPLCLMGQGPADLGEIVQGLSLTGYFLQHRLAADLGAQTLPEARQRFIEALARRA